MPESDADAQLGGLSGSAEMDFSDLWDFVEFGAAGRLEAWKQNWGLLFDASYMDLSGDYSKVAGPGGRVAIGVHRGSRYTGRYIGAQPPTTERQPVTELTAPETLL